MKSASEPAGESRIVREGDILGVKCSVVLHRAGCTTPSEPGGPGRLDANHQPAVSGDTASDILSCTQILQDQLVYRSPDPKIELENSPREK